MVLTELHNRGVEKRQRIIGSLWQDIKSLFVNCSSAGTYMTTDLEIVAPDAPVDVVIETMRKRGIRHILVCDDSRKLLGVISDRDVRTRDGDTAAEIMTRDPDTISEGTSMIEAVEIMLTCNFSSLPICRGDELCGLITTTDVILALQCSFGVLREVSAKLNQRGS